MSFDIKPKPANKKWISKEEVGVKNDMVVLKMLTCKMNWVRKEDKIYENNKVDNQDKERLEYKRCSWAKSKH